MKENYFRNNPTDGALGILQSRRSLWNSGKQSGHYRASMRDAAWIAVTIDGLKLPSGGENFSSWYGRGAGSPKPGPSLESVSITTAGEFGHALHVDVTFTCYLRSDFEVMDKRWLRNGKRGSVEFGYVKSFNASEQTYIKLEDSYVTTFSFNTNSSGHYICSLKMVGASRFAKSAEAKGGLKDGGKFKYKTKGMFGGTQTHEVTSLDELLLYDAQENGQTSTDDMPDNHKVDSDFGDIIVYHPPEQGGVLGVATRGFEKMTGALLRKGDKQLTYHHEYYSLEYVINRLINDQLLGFIRKITDSKSREILSKVKIVCNGDVTVGHGYPVIRSANPNAMLILGGGRGIYKNADNGNGKDWEKGGERAGASIKCHKGNEVDLSKVMLERTLITTVLANARAESEKTDPATQLKPNRSTDVLVYVEKFLNGLFEEIAYNTGKLFQLGLIENPYNRHELLVVDMNNGNANPLQVFMFDPIDGDGSTREMTITSNAGSSDFQAAMFGAVTKPSDINSTISNTISEVDGNRSSELNVVIDSIREKIIKTLPDSVFATDEVEGLRTLFVKYNQTIPSKDTKKNQLIIYPGMSLDVTLDGVWGFRLGNHIHTTLCPKDPYRIQSNGLCFVVNRVTHNFSNNQWETSLEAMMTFASPVEYV